ncbi:hypothetical protein FA09DRAFT_330845 [Tilletiopsis washingtonensis]|uniref:TTI1 C-terminal TPR domain-containing protein n=1 Tax=Tilletiopsis washingtonensis TaxID=58919 RepID=A0A316ZAI4_9BASI|nr:hypothetical protein FA09DRAFT_330845 [Tilletiopsis washingtonensis]PWN97213.1 hypothetical protein FA09DRAFT_330845 [Tilletiopsis washingtonensis]
MTSARRAGGASAVNMRRFQELKPTCVELLGLATPRGIASAALPRLLRQLHAILERHTSAAAAHEPLSPSLVHYAFFPLAQLLRASPRGAADLSDGVREGVFLCLGCLVQAWWRSWCSDEHATPETPPLAQRWQVWEQLLMLGAVALGGAPEVQSAQSSSSQARTSDETRLAVARFLQALLAPRAAAPAASDMPQKKKQAPQAVEWEWDGVSALPSLDDYEADTARASAAAAAAREEAEHRPSGQCYPLPAHVRFARDSGAARGALAHSLTAALDAASESSHSRSTPTELGLAALDVARAALLTWLTGEELSEVPTALSAREAAERAKRAAVFMPGSVSALVRIASGKAKAVDGETGKAKSSQVSGPLAAAATCLLGDLLRICLDDRANAAVQAAKSKAKAEPATQDLSLERLMAQTQLSEADVVESSRPEATQGDAAADTPAKVVQLASTLARVHSALLLLSPLVYHQHAAAQTALVTLASGLIEHGIGTISWHDQRVGEAALVSEEGAEAEQPGMLQLLVRWLLDIAGSPASPAAVTDAAVASVMALLAEDKSCSAAMLAALKAELGWSMQVLPRAVVAHRDERAAAVACRLSVLLRILSSSTVTQSVLLELVGPQSGAQRWAGRLLECLELSDEYSGNTATEGRRAARLRLKHLDALSSNAVLDMLLELGQASARLALSAAQTDLLPSRSDALFLVRHFTHEAARLRTARAPLSSEASLSRRRSASALLVADELLRGAALVLDDERIKLLAGKEGRRSRRAAHQLAREVVAAVVETWDADQEELLQATESKRASAGEQSKELLEAQSTAEIEQSRGLPLEDTSAAIPMGFGPALDLGFVASATLNSSGSATQVSAEVAQARATEQASSQLRFGDALLLSLLGSCAELLGTAYRPFMLHTLYPLICGLASQHAVVREAASEALRRIAHATAYASIEGCVLDHADYVLGAASHRLVAGLAPELEQLASIAAARQEAAAAEAPNALIESAHHGASKALAISASQLAPLVSAQTAPLVLIEVIRMLGSDALPLVEDAVDEVLDALDRFHGYDDLADRLIGVLDRLIDVMADDERARSSGRAARALHAGAAAMGVPDAQAEFVALQEWLRLRREPAPAEPAFDPRASPEKPAPKPQRMGPDDDPDAATRTQIVVSSILSKCVPFLSHHSASLRARVLRLLSRGVAILAPQGREAELLPVINSAWPIVLARLGSNSSGPGPQLRRGASVDEMRANLTEREAFVWIEAAALVEMLALHVPDFIGRKLTGEAWPRLARLLRIADLQERLQLTSASGPAHSQPAISFILSDAPSHAAPATRRKAEAAAYRSFDVHGPTGRMCLSTCAAVASIVRHLGASIEEGVAWDMATQPQLLACLDARQPAQLRAAAHDLYRALAQRNQDAVWAVLEGAMAPEGSEDAPGGFAAFLRQPHLDIAASRAAVLAPSHRVP